MKIKLKKAWSRAKTNKDGKIINWDDYKAGDIVEVSKKELEYFNEADYEILEEKKAKK